MLFFGGGNWRVLVFVWGASHPRTLNKYFLGGKLLRLFFCYFFQQMINILLVLHFGTPCALDGDFPHLSNQDPIDIEGVVFFSQEIFEEDVGFFWRIEKQQYPIVFKMTRLYNFGLLYPTNISFNTLENLYWRFWVRDPHQYQRFWKLIVCFLGFLQHHFSILSYILLDAI